MSDWRNKFKKFLKRRDFVEVHPQLLEDALNEVAQFENDTKRLDFLQKLTTGYGAGWILRLSGYGRGWRLHETSMPDAVPDIRDAIDKVMNTGQEKNDNAQVGKIALQT